MPNLTEWSTHEQQTFSHKLHEIIAGPGGDVGKIGFIFLAFPIEDSSRCVMLSPNDPLMVKTVLYHTLRNLVGA